MKFATISLFGFQLSAAALFAIFLANAIVAFLVAHYFGKQRVIGFAASFLVCILATSVVGLLVTLLSKTKNRQQMESKINRGIFDPESVEDELNKFQLLNQCGIISKEELKQETNRLAGKKRE